MNQQAAASNYRLLRAIYFATLLYWLAMVVALHIPIPKRTGGPPLPKNSDKAIHFVMYGLLAGLLSYALDERARLDPTTKPRSLAARNLLVFAVCSAHGAIDELTQPWTNRYCEPSDMLADAVGVAGAIMIYHLVGSRLPHSRSDLKS